MMSELKPNSRIHIVGAGGAGMSSIAVVLHQMGHIVSGSDIHDTPACEHLRGMGIQIHTGHSRENVGDSDFLAVSSAVAPSNPEIKAAREKAISVFSRAEILGEICKQKKVVAVAGAHGKTTTAAMLACILEPEKGSYIYGGEMMDEATGGPRKPEKKREPGGKWETDGTWLIVEADESDGTFLSLPRHIAVITSTDPDHLETYGSESEHQKAYQEFGAGAGEGLVYNFNDRLAVEIQAGLIQGNPIRENPIQEVRAKGSQEKPKITGYGLGEPPFLPSSFLAVENIQTDKNGAIARLSISPENDTRKKAAVQLKLSVHGAHNVLNAAAAVAAAGLIGIKPKKAASRLRRFTGTARRFEIKGEAGGVVFIDDYAHLPREITETIKAAADFQRSANGKNLGRLICVFQPHRYSRTETLWRTYADAFEGCDLLAVSEIYSAGEEKREGISGKLILNAVLGAHPRTPAVWIPSHADLLGYFLPRLREGDVFLTLNAGDLYLTGEKILEALKK